MFIVREANESMVRGANLRQYLVTVVDNGG